jgi:hypothetical protein
VIYLHIHIGVSDPYLTPDIQGDIHKESVLKIFPTPTLSKNILAKLPNFMEQDRPWEADGFLIDKEIPNFKEMQK